MLEPAADELLEHLRRVFPPGPFLDRRLGRAFAFQALYEMDQGHHSPNQVLERLAAAFLEDGPDPYSPELLTSATQFAQNCAACSPSHTMLIQRAHCGPVADVGVDRNVLHRGSIISVRQLVPLGTITKADRNSCSAATSGQIRQRRLLGRAVE
jgi:hypothetical protein